MRTPRLPRLLLAWLLPARVREALLRDLDEEFARHVLPGRGRFRARVWYWRQALGSIAPALRLRRQSRAWSVAGTSGTGRLDDLARDVRIGARRLRREPAFAAAVILTVAIGIGATTSIFAITHAVLLKGLPYRDPARLVAIAEIDTRRRSSSGNISYPDFLDYRTRNSTFESIAGYSGGSRTLIDANGVIDRVPIAEATPGFFAMLGVRLAGGRDFTAGDGDPGAPPVVILTDGAWRRRFGADPAIVGRAIGMGSLRPTVIGLLPREFEFPLRGLAEIWLPVQPTAAQRERRYFHWLNAIGRLAAGADIAAGQADLSSIAGRFADVDPQYHAAARVTLTPINAAVAGPVRPALVVLQAAAAILLLVACANVASLLIARGVMRAQELRVRAAIGAGRARLGRQLLAESLALAVPGALLGLAAGTIAVRSFVASLPPAARAALPNAAGIGLAPELVLAAAGLALLTAAGFGIIPAWRAGRRAGEAHLRAATHAPFDLRVQSIFVAGQLALAFALLTGAGLLGRSVYRLLQVSPGFDPRHVLTAQVNGQEPAYQAAGAARAMHDTLIERLAALPGAAGAATISQLPLAGRGNSGMFAVQSAPLEAEASTLIRTVSANYFDVMGVPLLEGRTFSRADAAAGPRVVLVNETLARTVLRGRALGERIAFPFFQDRPWWEIVGVVGDERFASLDGETTPVVYFPYSQSVSNSFSIVVRTSTPPDTLASALRDTARRLDPLLPVYQIETMEQMISRSDGVYRRRSTLVLLMVFAAAAIGLAAVALNGLLSHAVSQRTRELGIRLALGADRWHVLRAVVGRGAGLTAAGIGAGLLVTALSSRAVASLLYQVGSLDVPTLAAASILVAVIALIACLVPAARALRIDPARALRGDVN
jgi:predicted permease